MKNLTVEIEINGKSKYVGNILGSDYKDAKFIYSPEYLDNFNNSPISISLPVQEKAFDADKTRNFFEGLLPEGFIRKCVAEQMRTDENDYLTILAGLGNECLGAIKITDEAHEPIPSKYKQLTDKEVRNLAQEGATESVSLVTKAHLSLTGASGKVGLYYDEINHQWYLPIGNAPSTHIVKQSHIRLKKIVTNEQLCLLTAKNLGIDVPESFIVNVNKASDEDVLFATKRYDRKISAQNKTINNLLVPFRLHQEDFAQVLGISAHNKYEKNNVGYMKKLFDILRIYSSEPIIDQLKLWDICVFNYLVGNTDNHIKNLSLLYSEDLQAIRLAPAYDIISTVIYDSSTENMAFNIDGKYNINEITRENFINQANIVGLGKKMAMTRFDNMVTKFDKALQNAKEELFSQGFTAVEDITTQILAKGGIKFYR